MIPFFLRCSLLSFVFAAVTLPHAFAKEEETTPLTDAMDDINAAYRRLGRQVKDAAKNASSLEAVALLKKGSVASLDLIPELAADLPAEKREKFIAGYRSKMQEFIAEVDRLDAAFRAGNNAAAADILATMKDLRTEGHKAYKKPDKE